MLSAVPAAHTQRGRHPRLRGRRDQSAQQRCGCTQERRHCLSAAPSFVISAGATNHSTVLVECGTCATVTWILAQSSNQISSGLWFSLGRSASGQRASPPAPASESQRAFRVITCSSRTPSVVHQTSLPHTHSHSSPSHRLLFCAPRRCCKSSDVPLPHPSRTSLLTAHA